VSQAKQQHPPRERLAAFQAGRLAPEDAAALAQHLAACPQCRKWLPAVDQETLPPAGASAAVTDRANTISMERPADQNVHQVSTLGLEAVQPSTPEDVPAALADHPRYRVLQLLGFGGMGSVYKAEHRKMERLVAIKVLNPELIQNATALQRFLQEVKAAAKLAHPNIVTAYDADEADGVHFLIMEYVDGVSLADLQRKRGRMPIARASECIRQAAIGLQHAFEKGMVHRDIKPQNLMLSAQGRVKILDFGLARFVRESAAPSPALPDSKNQEPGLTLAGTIMGTPDYMAPEQATDARQADIRADIYSLGCTLYDLLAGQPPFPEGTIIQKVMAHHERRPRPLSSFRKDVPPELANIVAKMMAKNPAQRFQTPLEVARALAPIVKPGLAPTKDAEARDEQPGDVTAQSPAAKAPPPVTSASIERDLMALAQEERRVPRSIKPRRAPRLRRTPWYGRYAASLAAGAVLVGVLVTALLLLGRHRVGSTAIPAEKATLTLLANGLHAAVVVLQDGKEVGRLNGNSARSIELASGRYDLQLEGAGPDVLLSMKTANLAPGETVQVTLHSRADASSKATLAKSPTPLGADAEQARLEIERCTAALGRNPNDAAALLARGRAFRKLHNLDEQAADFAKVFEILPAGWCGNEDPVPTFQELAQANELFARIAERRPGDGRVWIARGMVYARRGEWARAKDDYGRAIELNPDEHQFWYRYGFLCLQSADAVGFGKVCANAARLSTAFDSAHRMALVCLLGTRAPADVTPYRQLASRAFGSERWVWSVFNPDGWGDLCMFAAPGEAPFGGDIADVWFRVTQGLAHYRGLQMEQTIQRLKCAANESGSTWAHATRLVLAMGLRMAGRSDEARQLVNITTADMDKTMPKEGKDDLGGAWHDWILCQILRREAESVFLSDAGARSLEQTIEGQSRLIAANPKDPEAWLIRGRTYALLGQWRDAAADFMLALDLVFPQDGPMATAPGERASHIAVELGQWQKAFEQAVRARPLDGRLWIGRGRQLWIQGELKQAAVCFDNAVERRPRDFWAQKDRAILHAFLGDWADAAAAMTQAAKLDAANAELWLTLGGLYLLADETKAYSNLCQRIRADLLKNPDRDPGLRRTYIMARTCLLGPGGLAPADAVRLTEHLVVNGSKYHHHRHTLALALYRAGRYDDAISQAHQCIDLWGDYVGGTVDSWLVLAMALHKKGNRAEAAQWLSKARQAFDNRDPERQHSQQHDFVAGKILLREAETLMKRPAR
jgi:serine/threonine protein kinase/tetratricopeptide (TPR) repeat protein